MIITASEIQYTDNKTFTLTSDVPLSPLTDGNNVSLWEYIPETSSYKPLVYNMPLIEGDVFDPNNEYSIVVSGSNIYVTISKSWNINKLYMVQLFYVMAEDEVTKIESQFVRFLTVEPFVYPNSNNTYTKLLDLEKILSVDNLLDNKFKEHTLNFYPTSADPNIGKDAATPALINIDNNELMLNLLLNQYFIEYKTFYDTVNSRNVSGVGTEDRKLYSDDYIKQLHMLFMKNIVKYQAFKGNKFLIDLYIGLYSKYLGYNSISVIEDAAQNFIYRISSSIPETVWNEKIKPNVHPMGWNCVYSEIPSTSFPSSNKLDYQAWMRTWDYDGISYLDADHYRKQRNKHYKQLFDISHVDGMIGASTVSAHEVSGHDNCTYKNPYDENKFNLNFNGMLPIEVDMENNVGNSLYDKSLKLNDIKNIYFKVDRINKKMYIQYKFAGIAHQYVWETFASESNIKTTNNTGLSINNIDFTDEKQKVILKLQTENSLKAVHQFDMLAFTPYKTLRYSVALNQRKNKFINVRASQNRGRSDDLISIQSFSDSAVYNTYAQVNNVDYNFSNGTFLAAIDTPTSLTATSTTFGAKEIVYVSYNFIGIANKYEWIVKVNNIEIHTYETFTNTATIALTTSDITNASITLRISHNTGTYTLSNIFSCSTLP